MIKSFLSAMAVVSFAALSASCNAAVIYDSATGVTLFGSSGWNTTLEQGGRVDLFGTERYVNRFGFGIVSGPIRGTEAGFEVQFYNIDDETGLPTTLIWESDYYQVSVDRSGLLFFLEVPDVLVSDSFIWTVEAFDIPDISTGNKRFGLTTGFGPNVGCDTGRLRLTSENDWVVDESPVQGTPLTQAVIEARNGAVLGTAATCDDGSPPVDPPPTNVPSGPALPLLLAGLIGLRMRSRRV